MEKKRSLFKTDIRIGGSDFDIAAVRELGQKNPAEFVRKIQVEIEARKFTWESLRSLKDLYHNTRDIQVPVIDTAMGSERAVMASAFQVLSNGLMIAGLQDAYDQIPTIGQELVQERDSRKKTQEYASVHTLDTDVPNVAENVDFPEISASEEWVQIGNLRNGRMISITSEMIEENDVSGIVDRTNQLAQIASDLIEEQTLSRVFDVAGSGASPAAPYAYKPKGVGTQLYNSTANNPGTRAPSGTRVNNNALVDETDLNAARAVLAAMKDNRGRRIGMRMSDQVLVVPDALYDKALRLFNSVMQPGVENEFNTWGPNGPWRPRIVSSPKIDDFSTTAWYLGNFRAQFIRKWKLRLETMTLSGNDEAFLKRRIAYQARVAWDCEVGATDYVNVVQSLAVTTAPTEPTF